MNRIFPAVFVLSIAAVAFSQDRTPATVLESSIVVTGGDYLVDQTGCYVSVRIAPVIDQKPPQLHQIGAAACTTLKALSLRAAKLDQGVGNGAAP